MKKRAAARLGLIALWVLLQAAVDVPAAWAHHSSTAFDESKTVTVSGIVTRYEWSNRYMGDRAQPGGARWVFRPDLQYAAAKCNPDNARRYIDD